MYCADGRLSYASSRHASQLQNSIYITVITALTDDRTVKHCTPPAIRLQSPIDRRAPVPPAHPPILTRTTV